MNACIHEWVPCMYLKISYFKNKIRAALGFYSKEHIEIAWWCHWVLKNLVCLAELWHGLIMFAELCVPFSHKYVELWAAWVEV